MKVKIALGQMHIMFGDPRRNLSRLKEWCVKASGEGNEILVLPELWLTGFDYANLAALASPIDQGYFLEVAQLAMQFQLMIIGSMIEQAAGRYYNTNCVFNRVGDLMASYRKLHLFSPMQEDDWFSHGNQPVSFTAGFGLGGLATCYDLRFPELFRRYAIDNVDICFLSAEWPSSRLAHWLTLNQARAIENQYFLVAVNATGQTGKASFGGHSLICDPWGQIVLDAGDSENLVSTVVDLDIIGEVRQRLPVLNNRRPDAYGI